MWLGSATFDKDVGLSRDTGQVTHHIGPDVDAERDRLTNDLRAAKVVEAIYEVTGVGPYTLWAEWRGATVITRMVKSKFRGLFPAAIRRSRQRWNWPIHRS